LNFRKIQILEIFDYECFLSVDYRLLSCKFFCHKKFFIKAVLGIVLCKMNYFWCNCSSSPEILLLNWNTKNKIKKMIFSFEFLNIHITHLAQLPMINMTLKWHHINICNKIVVFCGHSTCFLVSLTMIAPLGNNFRSICSKINYVYSLNPNIINLIYLLIINNNIIIF